MTPLRQWPARSIQTDDLRLSMTRRALFVPFIRRTPRVRRISGDCTLRVSPAGHWEITASGQPVNAKLQHVWPCFGWLSLEFSVNDHPVAAGGVRLTVWKHRTSPEAWRELRVITARQLAMPDRAVRKESP